MIKEIDDLELLNNLSDYKITKNAFNKVLGYVLNNEIIGYLDYSVMYDKIEINYIFVLESYRRKNIANQLLNYVINNYDFENITLEVNINNIGAINLYKKNGFNIIGIRPNYYNGIDAYLMERR